MLPWLLVALASASDRFVDVGPDTALGVGGGWPRAAPADDGWWFFWAAGGDYNMLPMSDSLDVVDHDRVRLTGHSDLVDNQIVPCRDGTWMHVASFTGDAPNDSAYAFRYDAGFGLLTEGTVTRSEGARTNDLAPMCAGGDFDLVGFNQEDGPSGLLFRVAGSGDGDLASSQGDIPRLAGGTLYWDPDSETIVAIGAANQSDIQLVRYDTEFASLESRVLPLGEGAEGAYWPQGILRINEHYVLAHMRRDQAAGFNADEGNVWLAVFDLDWNLVERFQVSQYTPPSGGMRPAMTRKDDTLLVLWDKENEPHAVALGLNLAAFGEDWVDTGGEADNGGDNGDNGGNGSDDGGGDTDGGDVSKDACGCTTGAPGGSVAALGLAVALGWRRRRRQAGVGSGRGPRSRPPIA